jgi:hypothetical protein
VHVRWNMGGRRVLAMQINPGTRPTTLGHGFHFGFRHEKSLTDESIRLFNLAPRPGLEPGTYGLTVRRSTD